MSNLSKLEFVALDISGKNYLSWVLDAEIHLAAKGLGNTITQGNEASSQDKAKAMIFLRHHLDEGLKVEYLTVKDPLELWTGLKERYDHLKATVLPKARYEWMHLRLQDFKIVSEYNSVVFRITSQLKLCGEVMNDEDLLEKTLTTFYASNMVLQQQYREREFKKYSELISCLLVAEQHNTLLLKNHEARPTGSAPLSEANMAARRDKSGKRQNNNHGHMNVHRYGNGKRRYDSRHRGGHGKRENNMDSQNNPSRGKSANCHRCGMKGHWKIKCRAPEYFVRLYQNSIKRKANNIGASSANAPVESHLTFKNNFEPGPSNKNDDNAEANLASKDDDFQGLDDLTHLEVEDFFGDQN
ncbi:uncharacterized protein [Nicotiana sylvestris]|uniref:Uncharacterized protein LOC104245073 n=1 Tax=Nicotiana sylvestris TaxID=4096 RepID=A0A1U7YI50_NICSY|nr:PREDICTED: uncharacterized protein LOC104245073 [Nicotiana sylvestris]XP_009798930.1 PREDICTED: uncharacterized protein LOC104245073 [Nicotiana sylvestris]